MLDDSHDPALKSWVQSANTHPDFPIQNLPLGVFRPNGEEPRVGVAIGSEIFDIREAARAGLFSGDALEASRLCQGASLNELMGAAPELRRALRRSVSGLLAEGSEYQARMDTLRRLVLHEAAQCQMCLPAAIGDYTDFFAGIHHAERAGRVLRPGTPLAPNYKYVPVAYHGRASTVGVAPALVRRPAGQTREDQNTPPRLTPSRKLDYEFELGIWIGPGNKHGETIPIGQASGSIFGYCILNDWSARDVQFWEAQPLGPFQAKSFETTVSPWIVTPEALAPFRAPQPQRPSGDPRPLDHLLDEADQAQGALDIQLEVLIRTARMRADGADFERISAMDALQLYWTPAQMVAHHTTNGCALRAGDLFGTGTISSNAEAASGCLLEQTLGGTEPVCLGNGETRGYLQDGDEVLLKARCHRDGFVSIGFGGALGEILPNLSA